MHRCSLARVLFLGSLCGALALPALAQAQADAGVATGETQTPVASGEAAPPPDAAHEDAREAQVAQPVAHDEAPATSAETTTTTTTTTTTEPTAAASAVPPPPEAATTTTTTTTTTTEPQAPTTPTPSATGSPSAAPVTAVVAGVAIRVTGIAHASVYASQGVESFGNANTSAPTSALNPALLAAHADDFELSFQVQQSRFGLTLGEGSPFRAVVEIDFIHFDQSSPTTQAFPRVRILQLEWRPDPNHRIFVGQGWDLFGNAIGPQLLSHSANLVGTMFQAGNIGFMRHQLGWEGRFGPVAIALALGLQGNNSGPTFSNLEQSATPTGSARFMYYLADNSVIGLSGIGTALRFYDDATGTDLREAALGGEAFADVTFGPVNIHAEVYIARNLANIGALNLAQGRLACSGMPRTCAMHDVTDAGGYVSGRLNLGEWSITAMYGIAGVLDPSQVGPGYTSAASAYNSAIANGTTPSLSAVGTTNGTPGMALNMSGHVGLWYSPMRGLSFVLEPYFYFSRFVMDGAVPMGMPTATSDAMRYGAQVDRFAAGGQFTTMFQF